MHDGQPGSRGSRPTRIVFGIATRLGRVMGSRGESLQALAVRAFHPGEALGGSPSSLSAGMAPQEYLLPAKPARKHLLRGRERLRGHISHTCPAGTMAPAPGMVHY